MSAVGRFIVEFQRNGLKPEDIYADAGGLGIPMCDALSEAGWDVHRVNNGERAFDDRHFANRGAEIWFKAARAIELCEIILPDDDLLHSQLTTRRTKHNSKGKLQLEPKDQMRSRGLPSLTVRMRCWEPYRVVARGRRCSWNRDRASWKR